jgi:hypothetical protein
MKKEYVYIVSCNRNPIVYGVYENKQDAVRYAISLIRFRKKDAKKRNFEFGFYHFKPFIPIYNILNNSFFPKCNIFSVCLNIKGNIDEYSDDGCLVTVDKYHLMRKNEN